VTDLLTSCGAVFWPVGTGDSTTIVLDDQTVLQVDLHDMAKADDDDTPEVPIVDRLAEALPQGNGRPYLAVFALTHADLDHCSGFGDLLDKVTIGELWATPRLWRELEEESRAICEDARTFHEEAERRVAVTRRAVADGRQPASGDRVRIIGHDTDRDLHGYADLPEEYLSFPGTTVTKVDGVDRADRFAAFIHAPFNDDCAGERNDTSLAMQVTLTVGSGTGQFLLLGDLAYVTLKKIFDYSAYYDRTDKLAWDVMLASHHCSKAAMYVDGELQQDVLDAIEKNGNDFSTIVSSSNPIPSKDTPGANPPHRVAADRYKEITDAFVCTMEHGSTDAPSPVVFDIDGSGIQLLDPNLVDLSARSVTKAFGASPNRLGLIAAAAARYGHQSARRTSVGGGESGPDRVRSALTDQRGGRSAPSGVVGFGSR